MTERKFTIIKGGADEITLGVNMKFISAFVTDTRLMGVVGLYIHWEVLKSGGPVDFHQFFYYDAEEYGLETYRSMLGDDGPALSLMEQTLIGGLGGKKVDVTEAEARFLVQDFAAGSQRLGVTLPDPKSEYAFLLQEPVSRTKKQKNTLIRKICTPIRSDHHLIHYFLMRCFALDLEAVAFLSEGEMPVEEVCGKAPATLCKNTISQYVDEESDSLSYLCEALIEIENRYKLMVLEISLDDGKVVGMSRRSSFFVTSAEAAMMLNRAEFITVYEIMTDPNTFDETFAGLTASAMQTNHSNGRLFLEFNKTNDHVNRQVFRLNEDIHGLFYVSDFGQLLAAAYGLDEIRELEKALQKSPLASSLLISARYEFKEPILYEFIQSDFEDFGDFLSTLQD